MRIIQTIELRLPRTALELGLTEGDARVVISVDRECSLEESFVVGYTHPSFGDAAVDAIKLAL